MAANKQRANLPSDPEVLLEVMQELPDDSGSEDEFDGTMVLSFFARATVALTKAVPPHSYLAVVQLRA